MKKRIVALLLLISLMLVGCNNSNPGEGPGGGGNPPSGQPENPPAGTPPLDDPYNNQSSSDGEQSYGKDIEDLGAMDGYFENSTADVEIECISGTPGCYKIEGNVITFTRVSAESAYSISGKLAGSIVIDTGDNYKFDLELCGLSLVSSEVCPITILSGDEISIKAKKNTKNYIYDTRSALSEDSDAISAAIYSAVDLEMSGKGELFVVSSNNNGIHSKKDLQVKNLSLMVSCKNNALKGNDSVELELASATLIASLGDCIKTTNSDISSKGNQRGTISFLGGTYNLYAACDGIDAAYNVVVDGENTVLNIYTDKYSSYSEEVTAVSESLYYISFTSNKYSYSVKYYNTDEDYTWVNAEYHSSVSAGFSQNHYYSFPKNEEYAKLKFFIYSSDMEQGQESNYIACSDYITLSDAYDTIGLVSKGDSIHYQWTNYGTTSHGRPGGGPGGGFPGGPGMEGNKDKGDHSTKGIKSANAILIKNGKIVIRSYDDAIHANDDETLENGETPTGNVTITGGNLTIYSNDDGIHADGALKITRGSVNVANSYEGIEGYTVTISGGDVSVISKDDGVNGMTTSGAAITVSGGTLYVYAGGDGIDSNSRASYGGIVFSGGKTLIISTSGGNSAIDSEAGYSYTGGSVVAVMPKGGMSNEAIKCKNFSSVGKSVSMSLTQGGFLVCGIGDDNLTVNMPVSLSAMVVALGDANASITTASTSYHKLDPGEFIWK